VYYTQFSLFTEKNVFRTTNYRKGALVPINTAVVLDSINTAKAELRLVNGNAPLTIENVPKHTVDDIQTAFKKIVAPRKLDLDIFTEEEQEAILAGQVRRGMGRRAVLAAIGYPPQVETPSLESNEWTYWTNRFNKFIVRFKGGKVDAVVD